MPCAPGSFFNTHSCELCPVGKYQPSQGQSDCLACPQNGVSTGPGAVSVDECKREFEEGDSFPSDKDLCACDWRLRKILGFGLSSEGKTAFFFQIFVSRGFTAKCGDYQVLVGVFPWKLVEKFS